MTSAHPGKGVQNTGNIKEFNHIKNITVKNKESIQHTPAQDYVWMIWKIKEHQKKKKNTENGISQNQTSREQETPDYH